MKGCSENHKSESAKKGRLTGLAEIKKITRH
jgi:hypothetical protein